MTVVTGKQVVTVGTIVKFAAEVTVVASVADIITVHVCQ